MKPLSTLSLIDGATLSYAQNQEDLILAGFFSADQKGFYVDVGANDPNEASVTKIFYDMGWSGINIEPIPKHFEQLKKYRPRDVNLNIGISLKEQLLSLREYEGSGLSTFSKNMQEKYELMPTYATAKYKDYTMPTRPLKDVFKENKISSLQFMKVDVEGFEYDVLLSNDWNLYRPQVLCIEANHVERDWRPILKENDYNLVFFDGLNEYYVDKTNKNGLKEFSYVDAIIFRKPIVDYLLADKLGRWVNYINSELQNYEAQAALLYQQEEQLKNLQEKYNEITPFKNHLKKSLVHKAQSIDSVIQKYLPNTKPFSPPTLQSSEVSNLELLIEHDRLALEKFNRSKKKPRLLTFYTLVRDCGIKMIKKSLIMHRVRKLNR